MIIKEESPPTEGGKGIQYLPNVEVMELYECWDLLGRLRRVVFDTLFYRQGFEKLTGY